MVTQWLAWRFRVGLWPWWWPTMAGEKAGSMMVMVGSASISVETVKLGDGDVANGVMVMM